MGDFDLRRPELHVPEPRPSPVPQPSPLALPPLHVAQPPPLSLEVMERTSPIYPYLDPLAIRQAHDQLPPAATPPPAASTPSPSPAARAWLEWQLGLGDDPSASLQASGRVGHSGWKVGAQVGASTQTDNPNSSDRVNRVQEHSPLGTPDFTPGQTQIPTQGQTPDDPPMSLSGLLRALVGLRGPGAPLPQVPLPPVAHETMCRDAPPGAAKTPAPRR